MLTFAARQGHHQSDPDIVWREAFDRPALQGLHGAEGLTTPHNSQPENSLNPWVSQDLLIGLAIWGDTALSAPNWELQSLISSRFGIRMGCGSPQSLLWDSLSLWPKPKGKHWQHPPTSTHHSEVTPFPEDIKLLPYEIVDKASKPMISVKAGRTFWCGSELWPWGTTVPTTIGRSV